MLGWWWRGVSPSEVAAFPNSNSVHVLSPPKSPWDVAPCKELGIQALWPLTLQVRNRSANGAKSELPNLPGSAGRDSSPAPRDESPSQLSRDQVCRAWCRKQLSKKNRPCQELTGCNGRQ